MSRPIRKRPAVLILASACAGALWVGSGVFAQTRAPGAVLYGAHCASCHGSDGKETEGGPPPLAGSAWVRGPESRLIKIVLHGLRGKIDVNGRTYNLEMPGFGTVLDDAEIAGLLSFVRRSWGGPAEPVTPEAVRRVREAHRERTEYWTVEELGGP